MDSVIASAVDHAKKRLEELENERRILIGIIRASGDASQRRSIFCEIKMACESLPLPITAKSVSELVGGRCTRSYAAYMLCRLAKRGDIVRTGVGKYKPVRRRASA